MFESESLGVDTFKQALRREWVKIPQILRFEDISEHFNILKKKRKNEARRK